MLKMRLGLKRLRLDLCYNMPTRQIVFNDVTGFPLSLEDVNELLKNPLRSVFSALFFTYCVSELTRLLYRVTRAWALLRKFVWVTTTKDLLPLGT